MAVGAEEELAFEGLDAIKIDEADLARRRGLLRRLPQYRKSSKEKLNRIILRKAGILREVEAAADIVQPEFVTLFLNRKKQLRKVIKGLFEPVVAEILAEACALAYIRVLQATADGESARDFKEVLMALLASVRDMGQNRAERRKDSPKDKSDVDEALAAAKANMERASKEAASGRAAVEARLKAKQVPPDHNAQD